MVRTLHANRGSMSAFGPIHPAFVHFPIALLALSVTADVVGTLRRAPAAHVVGYWSLLGATAGANAAVIAGLYDMEAAGGHDDLVHVHMGIGIALLVFLVPLTWWRYRRYRAGTAPGARYLAASLALFAGMFVQGLVGGELVFDRGVGVAVEVARAAEEHDDGHEHEPPRDSKMGDDDHAHPRAVGNGDSDEHRAHEADDAHADTDEHAHPRRKAPASRETTEQGTTAPRAVQPSVADKGHAPPAPVATEAPRAPSFSIEAAPWISSPRSRRPTTHPAHPASPAAPTPAPYSIPEALKPEPLAPRVLSAPDDAGTHEVQE